ncbi:Undecaprenyl pyrophosphate synthetase [sediment metagenome]|uniref:Undecaprenyl pyrophosphate synthetase n=1 Tax=sediment metagenome TaxID=749907 RepID=D9PKQ8_9ZZZZ
MSEQETPVPNPVPTCVGVIMDGNRRWARTHGLPALEGHRKGYAKLTEMMRWCEEAGVTHLVVYALSTENWNRSPEEVSYLMDLFRVMLDDLEKERDQKKIAIHFAGDLSRFPHDIASRMEEVHATNPKDAEHHLWVAASYGGKAEVLAGINTLLARGVTKVDERTFCDALWTAGMPDPDIILRTGGEKRLSNFLMWHSGYSELFFLDTKWPDLSKVEFDEVLKQFVNRKRNYGV